MSATYLDRILEGHRAAALEDERPLTDLRAAALDQPPARGFAAALAAASGGEFLSDR